MTGSTDSRRGITADVAVLGGGVVGLSAAYAGVRRGLKVVVVDDARPGWATFAGAGIVNPLDLDAEGGPAERARLALAGPAHCEQLAAELAEDGQEQIGYRRVGQIVVGPADAVAATAAHVHEEQMRPGTGGLARYLGEVQECTGGDVRAATGYGRDDQMALLLPGVAHVDGALLTRALASAVRTHGGVIVSGTAAIVPGSSSSIGLRWADSRVSAGAVIAATGAWLCEDPALIAIAQAVRPERGQIVHLATLGERSVAIPVLSSLTGGYVVAFDDGHVVVGATHERAGFDADVTAGGVNAVLRDGFDLAPGLKGARFLAARAGLRPTSVDGVPLLGSVPGLGHVVLAGGLGAHGLTLGPAIGRLALQLAVGDDAACDVAPLAPARFITHC